jgi:hypothetical protein
LRREQFGRRGRVDSGRIVHDERERLRLEEV